MIAATMKKLNFHFSRREDKKFPAKLCKELIMPTKETFISKFKENLTRQYTQETNQIEKL